jgi:hypothetical protein
LDYFSFIFATVGITMIITISSVFLPIREFVESQSRPLGELIGCSMCTGFWMGVLISSLSYNINPVYGGAIASFFSWFLIGVAELIQLRIMFEERVLDGGEEESNG